MVFFRSPAVNFRPVGTSCRCTSPIMFHAILGIWTCFTARGFIFARLEVAPAIGFGACVDTSRNYDEAHHYSKGYQYLKGEGNWAIPLYETEHCPA